MTSESPSESNFSADQNEIRVEISDFNEISSEASSTMKRGKWTPEEDQLLRKYAIEYGEKNWKKISQKVPGRNATQCIQRWNKILKPGLVKGPWTKLEDEKLLYWVNHNGCERWTEAGKYVQGRSGKQCRERWYNVLCPEVKKEKWTEEEDRLIFALYNKYGSVWSQIAKLLPGRTENSIKNRYYSTLRKLSNLSGKQNIEEEQTTESHDKLKLNLALFEDNLNGSNKTVGFYQTSYSDDSIEEKIEEISSQTTMYKQEFIENENNARNSSQISEEEKPKKSYYKSKKKINREKSDKFFESFKALQNLEAQQKVSERKNQHEHSKSRKKKTYIPQTFHEQILPHRQETSPEAFTEPSSGWQNNFLQLFSNSSESDFKTRSLKNSFSVQQIKFNNFPVSNNRQKDELPTDYNDLVFEKVSFGARMLTSVLTLPSRIIDECLSKQANGTQVITNLLKTLDTFADHNIDTLILSTQAFATKNGITEKVFNADIIKKLVLEMSEALNHASRLHFDYSKRILDLSKNNMSVPKEKIHHLFGQLSSLQKIIAKVMGQMANLQESSYFENETYVPQEVIKVEESDSESQKTTELPAKQTITIKIGHFNSNLEQISKKRILG